MPTYRSTAVSQLSFIQLMLITLVSISQAAMRTELFIVPPGETSPRDETAKFNLSEAPVECIMSMPFLAHDLPGLAQYNSIGAWASPQEGIVNFQEFPLPYHIWITLVTKDWGEVATTIFSNGNGKQLSSYSNNLHVQCYQNITADK